MSLQELPVTTLIRWAFDNELSCYLDRLFALRRKRLPSRGIVICLRFLQALILRDAKPLGRLAHQRHDLSRSDDTGDTAGSPDRSLGLRDVRGKGRGIEHFALGDDVRFRLSLSVKPLHGGCAKRGTGNYSQHDLG